MQLRLPLDGLELPLLGLLVARHHRIELLALALAQCLGLLLCLGLLVLGMVSADVKIVILKVL